MNEQQRRRDRRPRVSPEQVGQSPEERVYRRGGFGEAIRQWSGIWMAVILLFLAGLIALVVFASIY